ncbi:MAG: hypothetical protein FE834_07560, partial [Gammaproteobacteria bacterium]|nr:hypothetical protein [Gammaproteobacteria bacterium]
NPTAFRITAGNEAGLFKINNVGQIQVAKAELDYETAPVGKKYTLTVKIKKDAIAKEAQITINIINVSETVGFEDSASSATESSGTKKLVVKLDAASDKPTTITYAITGTAELTEDYTITGNKTVTIAAGETQNTIDISIEDDSKYEKPETIIITLKPSSYTLDTPTHTHTITNDDAQPIVSFASRNSATPEADSSENLTVTLNTASGEEVVVNYTVSGTATNADYTLANGTLTFAPGMTTRDISLQIKADNIDEEDETVIVTLADDSNLKDATLGINKTHTHAITDNDTRGLFQSATELTVSESSPRPPTYAFKLNTQPTGRVTVYPISENKSAITISPDRIIFTQDDWDKEQTFTVTGQEDDNATNERFNISHIVKGADYEHYTNFSTNDSIAIDLEDITIGLEDITIGLEDITTAFMTNIVAITMRDNDTQGITLSTHTLAAVPEKADPAQPTTYTLTLNAQPTGDVTITPISSNTDAATVSGAITFTTSDWNSPKTITITGVNDDNATKEQLHISHTATGADYKGVSINDVAITMDDDDTRGITQPATTFIAVVPELGTVEYTLKLNTQPTANVIITPISSNTDAATVSDPITFTTSDWNSPKTITITGVDDNNTEDEELNIRHIVEGADYGSNGIGVTDIAIKMLDNDTQGIAPSTTTLTVSEIGQATYTLRLNTQPTGDVTITPISNNLNAATVSGAITFTTSDWNTEKLITVKGVTDANVADEQLNISHTVTGANYEGISVSDINITVTDNTLIIEDQILNIDENSAIGSTFDALTTQGNPTEFKITAGNTEDAFKIDNSGIITVDKNVLDYETLKKYTLVVQISKTGSTSETATITININDINELVGFDTATSSSGEANTERDLVVTLNTINSQVVTVDYTIANGT